MKILISKKQIVDIREFMASYIGKEYDGNNKLTHNEMKTYIYEKRGYVLKKVSLERVKTEQILTGEFIAVRDESSKILFYVNPKRLSLNSLLNELNSKANLERTNETRRHNLLEQGYQEAINGVVKIEDIEEEQYYYAKPNRNRQFVKSQKHKTKRY